MDRRNAEIDMDVCEELRPLLKGAGINALVREALPHWIARAQAAEAELAALREKLEAMAKGMEDQK